MRNKKSAIIRGNSSSSANMHKSQAQSEGWVKVRHIGLSVAVKPPFHKGQV